MKAKNLHQAFKPNILRLYARKTVTVLLLCIFFVDTSEGQSKAFKEASLLCVHQPPPLLPLRRLLPPLSPL